MRTGVHEQRVVISLTRTEAKQLQIILDDFQAAFYADPRFEFAGRLHNAIVARVRDIHQAQKSLSIARGNDRRNA